jgi:nucleoside-diphosphate-sugar epimerase
MKVLFTGASSFTGFWFVRELARAGHEVAATFSTTEASYDGVRRARVDGLGDHCTRIFDCSFGSDRFHDLVDEHGPWDVLCHHAADVRNYKSDSFDYVAALAANTHSVQQTLSLLRERGCERVCLTGSAFEGGEAAGSQQLPAFSSYGLSKEITYRTFVYFCTRAEMRLSKFVIPNPFGPFEEPRFTAYLIKTWREGRIAEVRTPDYVRDNIHIDLLASVYRQFVEQDTASLAKLNPSGYVESQGRFAERFAAAMGPRLGLECGLDLVEQTAFDEPRVRINTDPAAAMVPEWSEEGAWDNLANYYRSLI